MKTYFYPRRLITAIVLLSSLPAFAQSNSWDTLPWKTVADQKLLLLNKNLIPTGILYDRVFPIADVDEHLGFMPVPDSKSLTILQVDTTSPGQFLQAYYELYNSAYNTSPWIHPDTLDNRLKYTGNYQNHPIGIFMYKLNSIDTNALQDHLLDTTSTGQFIDVQNPSRSPYFTHNSFFASPLLAEDEVLDSGMHAFYFDAQYLLQNQGITITEVRVDFGDGQPEWVVSYPFGGGQSSGSRFGLSILKNLVSGTLIGRIIVVGIDILGNTIQYGNVFKITVKAPETTFQLTPCKGERQKWVIEAPQARIDPFNLQYGNPQLKYEKVVAEACPLFTSLGCVKRIVPVKDTAYFFFSQDGSDCAGRVVRKPVIFIDGFDPTNDRGVRQIYANYINRAVDRNGSIPFGDYMLDTKNFDLIILDFKHGNDLIERNAMTLVSLIERLNTEYATGYEQDITIIGPSMGSLVAQFALAYMEHNNITHRVKTFISFDGCHQGANVPIGLQNYVEYFTKKGILKNVKLVREGLYNGPAAKQMLAHHTSANSAAIAPDVFRNIFLQNLAAVGEYPQLCRKVAIINGTNTGMINPFHFAYNHSLLRIYTQRKSYKSVWGACNDKICMKLDWECYTTPAAGPAKVTDMWTVEPIFNLLFWVPLGRKLTYANPAWNSSAQDNAPGGTFGTLFGSNPGDIIESKFRFLLKEAMYVITGSKRTKFTQNINEFTMMPSYSAADLRFPVKDLNLNWSVLNLCGNTPFDYIYAPDQNLPHVSISPESSWWFENEIKCSRPDLPVFMTIYGANYFCSGSSNYTVGFCTPSNMAVTWSASPAGIVSVNGSGNSISVTKLSSGMVTLTATATSTCGASVNFSKNIQVGTNTPSFDVYAAYGYCQGNGFQAIGISTGNGTVSYNWYINGVLNSYHGYKLVSSFPNNNTRIELEIVNSSNCISERIYQDFTCNGFQFSLNPNPGKDLISIEMQGNNKIKQVKIVDKLGNIKKLISNPRPSGNMTLNIQDLKTDIYTVQVYDGVAWSGKMLSIQ